MDNKAFILAGNATFTAQSINTGTRFTYKVQAPWDKKANKRDHDSNVRFVSVLTGSDNTSDYSFLGTVFLPSDQFPFSSFKHSLKSKITKGAKSYKAFNYVWHYVGKDKPAELVEIFHEGKCGRCGRKLTDPNSIKSGFGPECINHI